MHTKEKIKKDKIQELFKKRFGLRLIIYVFMFFLWTKIREFIFSTTFFLKQDFINIVDVYKYLEIVLFGIICFSCLYIKDLYISYNKKSDCTPINSKNIKENKDGVA